MPSIEEQRPNDKDIDKNSYKRSRLKDALFTICFTAGMGAGCFSNKDVYIYFNYIGIRESSMFIVGISISVLGVLGLCKLYSYELKNPQNPKFLISLLELSESVITGVLFGIPIGINDQILRHIK